MPTPLLFSIGIIVGVEKFIPLVFCRIVTVLSSIWYSRSKSDTIWFVFPSRVKSFGAEV